MSMEEKMNQAKGAIKEGLGKVAGDIKLEKEGAAEKATAKVKELTEDVEEFGKDVKDAIDGTLDGIKNMIHKDKK